MNCYVNNNCSRIQCCTDLPLIKRTIESFIEINPCTKEIEIGIENMQYKIGPKEYIWGAYQTFDMNGIFTLG